MNPLQLAIISGVLLQVVHPAVLRHNHGVIFHDVGYMTTNVDNFHYVFAIPFPSDYPQVDSQEITCAQFVRSENGSMESSPFLTQCRHLQTMVAKMYNDTYQLAQHLNTTIQHFTSLLPKHKLDKRQKRKLFSFLGDMWQALTGSPSERSFKNLKYAVAQLDITIEYFWMT